MSRHADALIVGGGPAGAALAIRLAGAGREAVLLERTAGATDKVCGEFLSGEAIGHLGALGIGPAALGAVPIETLRLTCGGRTAAIRLPFPAISLSRRTLDEALLSRATAAGAIVRRGAAVRSLTAGRGLWEARLDTGGAVFAPMAFLATGKHDLRGWKRPPGIQSDLIGFKMHWRLSPGEAADLGRAVEIALFAGGYAGLEAVEDGYANLCLLIRRRRFTGLGRSWGALLQAIRADSPLLDRRLDGARARWPRPLAVGAIPFGHMGPSDGGPWRVGDQAAVVPSFIGNGISVALHSAALAARICLAGGSATDYGRALAGDVAELVRYGAFASRLAMHPVVQRALTRAAGRRPALLATWAQASRLAVVHKGNMPP
jgi:flavin-dependent dehydrogenase